jgi:hypothetical protein
MKVKHRLSYIEVFIMVFVLGIAARLISPQSTEASVETKTCSLVDGLEAMRTALDLYRVHHEDCLPPVDSFAGFETALTTKAGKYVPYIEQIPVNPFNNLNTVRFDGEPAGAGKAGWKLDIKTGLFQADNDTAHAAL